MTLQQLAYLIAQVLTGQISLMAAIDKINRQLAGNATEATAEAILTEVVSTGLAVANGTTGLVNAYNQARTDTADILAAIAAITPTPAAPPPTAAQNAQAVWSYDNGGTAYRSQAAWWALENTYTRVVNMMHGWMAPALSAPGFYLYTPEPYVGVSTEYLGTVPEVDWSALGDFATVLAWLQATELHFTWSYDNLTGYCHTDDSLPGSSVWWCTVRNSDLATIQATAKPLPPVWPGLSNVTLGTPVALAPDLTITTPMDGVVIEITGVASKYNSYKFSYDGLTSYRKLGALTFLTDRGDAEMFQMLSFELAVYCPTKMAQAASVKLECATGTTGTITPWLRTVP